MVRTLSSRSRVVWLAIGIALPVLVWAQAPQALSEKSITDLIEFGIEDATIVGRIQNGGVAFDADDATLERLKKANASDAVLNAVRRAADSKKGSKPAITYGQIVELLKLGIDEDAIIKRLEKSPTVFTIGDDQSQELKGLGATDKLLKAMAGQRGAPATEVNEFAIVFDCSASMAEKTENGQTKMAVAQHIVAQLIDRIPNNLGLTFVVYGHDRQRACDSAAVVRPLAPINDASKEQLKQLVRRYQPAGNTPIALGLRVAGKELTKNDTFCGMVLVSDGKETCNGDPEAEAAKLAQNPKLSFGIHVVGFDVQPEERESLEAIAKAGKGEYYNAQTAEELAKSLDEIAKDLKERAKPPKVKVNRRLLEVVSPKIEMPEIKEIYLAKEDAPLTTIKSYQVGATLAGYDKQLNVPSSAKHIIVLVPKNGRPVKMVEKFSIPEPDLVQVRPEEHVGLVKVGGQGTPKNIFLSPTGSPQSTAHAYSIQETKKFDDVMIVPAGEYDVYVDNELIYEKLKVEAGKLKEL
jgi:hypothetical protein